MLSHCQSPVWSTSEFFHGVSTVLSELLHPYLWCRWLASKSFVYSLAVFYGSCPFSMVHSAPNITHVVCLFPYSNLIFHFVGVHWPYYSYSTPHVHVCALWRRCALKIDLPRHDMILFITCNTAVAAVVTFWRKATCRQTLRGRWRHFKGCIIVNV